MVPTLSSVTAIIVVRDYPVDLELVGQLSKALSRLFLDVETVVIANGVSGDAAIRLKGVIEWLPDSTVLFLGEEVHDDVARLLGVDYAISDYVLLATPIKAEIEALPGMIEALREGNDLVIGKGDGGVVVRRNPASVALFGLFRGIYRLLARRPYEANPPMFRMLTRAAALYIASSRDGEVLVRARSLGQGFPSAIVAVPASPLVPRRGAPPRMAAAKALRLILTGSALPLRLSSYIGLIGGVASVVYAIYVVLIYALKTSIEPGWTTLSLQSAGMMFLLSIQFLFISEYLVQILSTSRTSGRRQLVTRELRSGLSTRSDRLNVIDSNGRFQVGAPRHYVDPEAT